MATTYTKIGRPEFFNLTWNECEMTWNEANFSWDGITTKEQPPTFHTKRGRDAVSYVKK